MARFSNSRWKSRYQSTVKNAPNAGVIVRHPDAPAPAPMPAHQGGTHGEQLAAQHHAKSVRGPMAVIARGEDEDGPWEVRRPAHATLHPPAPPAFPGSGPLTPHVPPAAPAPSSTPSAPPMDPESIMEFAALTEHAHELFGALKQLVGEGAALLESLKGTVAGIGDGHAQMDARTAELIEFHQATEERLVARIGELIEEVAKIDSDFPREPAKAKKTTKRSSSKSSKKK